MLFANGTIWKQNGFAIQMTDNQSVQILIVSGFCMYGFVWYSGGP